MKMKNDVCKIRLSLVMKIECLNVTNVKQNCRGRDSSVWRSENHDKILSSKVK